MSKTNGIHETEQFKEKLVAMAKQSYREALFAGTSGNLSIYLPEEELMLITPSSLPYETMTEADVVSIRLDGTVVDSDRKPSTEWRMHAEIYKSRPEIRAIVHTHSPYATAFAVNHEDIPVILIEMVPFLGGSVRLAEFAMPGTPEVGTEALKVLTEHRTTCLLANHGVLAVGESLEKAHTRAIYVEDAARILSLARANGGQVYEMSEKDIAVMLKRVYG